MLSLFLDCVLSTVQSLAVIAKQALGTKLTWVHLYQALYLHRWINNALSISAETGFRACTWIVYIETSSSVKLAM